MQSDSNNPYSPPPIPQQTIGSTTFGSAPFGASQGPRGFIEPHRGGLILGLGIGSLGSYLLGCWSPVCGLFNIIGVGLGIAAWVMANKDLRAMRTGLMDPSGRGNTNTGKVMGMIAVILFGVMLLITLVLAIFAGAVLAAILGGAAAGAAGGP